MKKIAFVFLFAVMVVTTVKIAKAQGVLPFGAYCLIGQNQCASGLICIQVPGAGEGVGMCVLQH